MDAKSIYRAAIKKVVFITLFTSLCLFGAAGTFRWWNAWAFVIANIIVVATLTGVVFRDSPDLVKERATGWKKAKSWDKAIVPILVAVFPLLTMVLSGLDRRSGWTDSISAAESVIAFVVMISSNAFAFWAMKVNRFFSSHVRIQTERGHEVISDGPYALVRHPGYAAMMIHGLAVPVLLGSTVGLLSGAVSACLWVLRTFLEDRTLQAELPGYLDYVKKVRYRLVPLLW